MIQRREGRELVIKALYAEDISGSDWDQLFNYIVKSKFRSQKKNLQFVRNLYYRTLEHKQQIDAIIQDHIRNWRIDRLATFDKVVLRIALCEFLYFEEIPTKVTINEAIEIAKDYSTSSSGKFINGILDSALNQLQEDDKINKSGRGLIQSSIN